MARAALARGESLQRLADSPPAFGTPAAHVHLKDARKSFAVAEVGAEHRGDTGLHTAVELAKLYSRHCSFVHSHYAVGISRRV